jgi:2'-5' RNA ligase
MLRLFVAVDLPQPMQQAVAALFADIPGARWVKPYQLHVTLRFLGKTPEAELPEIRTRLASVHVPAFTLAAQGIGCFPPDARRPRVLWLGLAPRQPLDDLAREIARVLRGLAASAQEEQRPFSPHLTLARLGGKADLSDFLAQNAAFGSAAWSVDRFHLYRSTLGAKGAVHDVLATYPLASICREPQGPVPAKNVPTLILDERSTPVPIAPTGSSSHERRLPVLSGATDFAFDTASFEVILDRIEDGVYFVDRDRRIRFWNNGAEALTGFSPEDVLGASCGNGRLCHVDEDGRSLCSNGCPIAAAISREAPCEQDAFLQHKLGHRVPVRIKTWPLRDSHGQLIGAVEIFRCTMTDRRQEQIIEQLAQLAMLDDLTRLPNRRHFDLQLDRRLAELNRFGWPFGVLMIDLDHFKQINDGHGHHVGDQILVLVARTLQANCRSLDTVARWGGEEFAVLIANVREAELLRVAEKLRAMVESSGLRESASAPARVTVSIGCAMAHANEPAANLMKRADEMLYAAKRGGRNRVQG